MGEIGEAIQSGVASFKIFTTFHARVPMGHLWEIFQEVGKHGGIMAVHAEEDDIVTYMEEKLEREGRDHGSNLHLAHNNISEDISFRKVVRLAQKTETGIYFVHTTAKEGRGGHRRGSGRRNFRSTARPCTTTWSSPATTT